MRNNPAVPVALQRPRQFKWARRWRAASPLALGTAAALLAFYSLIFVVPFGISIWLSLQNWDFISEPVFVGLRNYRRALSDPYFWAALRVTLLFSLVEIAVAITLAIAVAVLLSRLRGRVQRALLALIYVPVVTPGVVSILLWRWLYLPNGGALNGLLATLGLPQQLFLNSSSQALWSITAYVVWAYLGTGVVLFVAGINDIPQSLLEASMLDGASFLKQVRYLILPLLRPVIIYQVVVSVIGTVQMFEVFLLMTGPGFSTRTLVLYTYQLGFTSLDLGYGAAISLIIFLLLLGATIVQLRRNRIEWEY